MTDTRPAAASAASTPAPLPLREAAPASAPADLADNTPLTAPAAKSEPPDAPAVRAGILLRQVREAAGVDAELLANALKVPLHRIQALEAGKLQELPDITFARGLASSICRHLGGDAAAVLACMPTSRNDMFSGPASNVGNAPFQRPGDQPASLLSHLASRTVLILLALILLGAAALWLLPTLPIQLNAPDDEPAPGAETHGMVVESLRESPAPSPTPVPAPAPSSSPAPSMLSAPAPFSPQTPAAAPDATPAPADAPAPAPEEAAPAAASAAPLIAFNATQPAWISVRDAKGKNLLDRTLQPGEQASVAQGELPLAVKIGKADGVSVTVRGEPFDAKALARGSVARFEVK